MTNVIKTAIIAIRKAGITMTNINDRVTNKKRENKLRLNLEKITRNAVRATGRFLSDGKFKGGYIGNIYIVSIFGNTYFKFCKKSLAILHNEIIK